MKYLCKRLAAGCLALAMLAGCAPAAPAPSPAVGGYRETEITPDDSLENATICTDEEGRLHLFSTDAAYGELPEFVQHTVYADDEWQYQPADWAGQLAELCPAPDADGLYSITFGVEQAEADKPQSKRRKAASSRGGPSDKILGKIRWIDLHDYNNIIAQNTI